MRKMKSLAYSLLLTAAVLPLVNCGGSAHDPTETYNLITVNTKIPYWQAAAAGLAQAGGETKVKYETLGPESYDPQAEQRELRRVLQQRDAPSGILISAADSELLRPDIDAAITQGVPVITMDSDSPASKRLTFIGTDNYEAGRMGANITVKQLQGKGNVVVYTMPEQANLRERMHGYQEVFSAHPGIKVVDTVDIKGNPTIAFDRTMDAIEKNRPVDAFVCLEALACPEVAEVLNRKQVKGKVVVAMDTDQRTLDGIRQGVIAATIAQKPFTMAYVGLQMLDAIHHHKPKTLLRNWSQDTRSPFPAFIDTGATLIQKDNVDSFLKGREGPTQTASR
jgi:ribose transport system substrate-binding protein